VLALLYGCGLRRSEAVNLELSDVDLADGTVTVRRGKGGKDRVTYAGNGNLDALQAWAQVRGGDPAPFLAAVDKAGTVRLHRLTPQALYLALRKRAREAGVSSFFTA